MAILMGDLRAALVNAGATKELANKAATEVASYEACLASVETRLSVLTWVAGANIAVGIATMFRIFH